MQVAQTLIQESQFIRHDLFQRLLATFVRTANRRPGVHARAQSFSLADRIGDISVERLFSKSSVVEEETYLK